VEIRKKAHSLKPGFSSSLMSSLHEVGEVSVTVIVLVLCGSRSMRTNWSFDSRCHEEKAPLSAPSVCEVALASEYRLAVRLRVSLTLPPADSVTSKLRCRDG
jgi:hypothetical protein